MGISSFLNMFYAVTCYIIVWTVIGLILKIELPHSVLIYHDNGTIYAVSKYFSGFLALSLVKWFFLLLFIISSRMVVIQLYWATKFDSFDFNDNRKNIIIYGAGEAGIQLATAFNYSKDVSNKSDANQLSLNFKD